MIRRALWGIAARALVLGLLLSGGKAYSHDAWSNGNPIPQWVKDHCCNSGDAHDLSKEMGLVDSDIKVRDGGEMAVTGGQTFHFTYYRVKGFANEVVATNVFPSQDTDIWAFYGQGGPPQAMIYCLFVPCVSNDRMPKELDSSCS